MNPLIKEARDTKKRVSKLTEENCSLPRKLGEFGERLEHKGGLWHRSQTALQSKMNKIWFIYTYDHSVCCH